MNPSRVTVAKILLLFFMAVICFIFIQITGIGKSSESMSPSPSPFPGAELTYSTTNYVGCGNMMTIVRTREYIIDLPIDTIEKYYIQELPKFCTENISLTPYDDCPACQTASCSLSNNQLYYLSVEPTSPSRTRVYDSQTILLVTEQNIACP